MGDSSINDSPCSRPGKNPFRKFVLPTSQKLDREFLKEKLFRAVIRRNIPEVRSLVANGADPNFHDVERGETPLHQIAERDDYELGVAFLESGKVNLEVKDDHGNTPLHWTCYLNREKFTSLLLDRGANPDARDSRGKTPLHLAVARGLNGTIRKLLDAGADVNVLDDFENTPLSLSILGNGHAAISRLLLGSGADLSLESRRSLHLFFEAILSCRSFPAIDSILLLLANGVDVNMTEEFSGRNCLHFVAITGYAQLAAVLVENGADASCVDHLRRTPAETAKMHQHARLARYFRLGSTDFP